MKQDNRPRKFLGFLPASRQQVANLFHHLLKVIEMNQTELAQRLDAANARAKKVALEQAAALQALRDEIAAGGPISDEVEAKLAALEATIQSEDDKNPDSEGGPTE